LNKIKDLEKEIKNLGEKPLAFKNITDNEKIKKLNTQLEKINMKKVLEDKNKNKIIDQTLKDFKIRFQIVKGYPSKELRSLIDQGKKDIKKGVVVVYTVIDEKVGIAVGVTSDLSKKYNAVELVKLGSNTIEGTGGGGRNDFAQAGGKNVTKIEESFNKIIESIKQNP